MPPKKGHIVKHTNNSMITHMDSPIKLSWSIFSKPQDKQTHVVLCAPSQTKAKAPWAPL